MEVGNYIINVAWWQWLAMGLLVVVAGYWTLWTVWLDIVSKEEEDE